MNDETIPEKLEVPVTNDMAAPPTRPVYAFRVTGECLKPGAPLWTPSQREKGVMVEIAFSTSDEEEGALDEAARSGKLAAITLVQIRRQLWSIDGARIHPAERGVVWEALGTLGRQLAIQAFNIANAPSPEARSVMAATFRIAG